MALAWTKNTVQAVSFVKGELSEFYLPTATGGTGAIQYAISPALPNELYFDILMNKIVGIPTERVTGELWTYSARDATGKSVSMQFRIFITETPYTFGNEQLISLLPPNRTELESAIEMLLRANILPIDKNGHARLPILDAWNPDTIPEEMIPYLGLNLSMDIDTAIPIHDQRELLRKSYDLHKAEGTVGVLYDLIFALGYHGATIIELEDANWYQFKIVINQTVSIPQAQILLKLMKEIIPVHSSLQSIDVTDSGLFWDGTPIFDGNYTYGEIGDLGVDL